MKFAFRIQLFDVFLEKKFAKMFALKYFFVLKRMSKDANYGCLARKVYLNNNRIFNQKMYRF